MTTTYALPLARWFSAGLALVACLLAAGCADSIGGESPADAPSKPAARKDPFRAAREGDLKSLKALIEQDSTVLEKTVGPDWTLLHVAAEGNQRAVIEYLASKGLKVDVHGGNGEAPLHRAASAGSLDAVKALVRLGADPKVRSLFPVSDQKLGRSALSAAAANGHLDVVEFLLEQGAPVAYGFKEDKWQPDLPCGTALHSAAAGRIEEHDPARVAEHLKAVDLLAQRLGDVNMRATGLGHGDPTPLWMAAHRGNLVVVKHLLENYPKIDANAADIHQGDTALHLLVPNSRADDKGRPAQWRLHVQDIAETIRFLLKHGANPHLRNRDRETPFQKAVRLGDPTILEAFEDNRQPAAQNPERVK